jgi:RNase P protein component
LKKKNEDPNFGCSVRHKSAICTANKAAGDQALPPAVSPHKVARQHFSSAVGRNRLKRRSTPSGPHTQHTIGPSLFFSVRSDSRNDNEEEQHLRRSCPLQGLQKAPGWPNQTGFGALRSSPRASPIGDPRAGSRHQVSQQEEKVIVGIPRHLRSSRHNSRRETETESKR